MARFKFICYVILMSFVYTAVGAFLAAMVFMFLSHTTVAVLHDTLSLTPTQFVELCATFGGMLGFSIGWGEGSEQYLAKGN